MLQLIDEKIVELPQLTTNTVTISGTGGYQFWPENVYYLNPVTYWNNYPIYIKEDKTDKAIKILQALQKEKMIEVKSVTRFVELVEKIKGLL